MEKERNYGNDGLDLSEEYFRKKKNDNEGAAFFNLEGSEPTHY